MDICFCFLMHAPYRLRRYRFFEIGQDHYYPDDMGTEEYITRLVQTSYMPLAQTIREMIRLSKGKFRCGLAISGTTLEMMEQYTPEMIDLLKDLADSHCVEMVAMPYTYSLACQYSETEWAEQLRLHRRKMEDLFGTYSQTLFNTELLYSDELAETSYRLGYPNIMTEGAKHILSYKSPNYLYAGSAAPQQNVLMRNMALSEALCFHFSDTTWPDYPMDAEKFIASLEHLPQEEKIVNLWMGAETFGMVQRKETGILEFMKALPYYAMEHRIGFATPSQACNKLQPVDHISVPYPITWAGENKGLSTYDGNDLQQETLLKLYQVAERVQLCTDNSLKANWLILQDVHYLHYMNHIDRGDSNFESAYDAFINYMNILSDFLQQVDEQYPTTIENEELNALLQTIHNQENEINQLRTKLNGTKRRKQ